MKKQIIIGSLSTFVAGILFHVIIPAILQFVISALLSAGTILDPLHAKDRLETFWTAFIVTLVLQIVFTIFIAFSVGISISFLSQKIKSGWSYAVNALLSLAVHYIFLLVFGAISLIFADKDTVIGFTILFLVSITITAPIIGLICTAFVRKYQVKKE